MNKIIGILAITSLASATAIAQLASCTRPINDNARVLSVSEMASLSNEISNLGRDGVDVRIITDDNATIPVENYAPSMARSCREWQNTGGGVKNNLVVLVNYPKQKKINLVSGKEYASTLNQNVVNDIKTNFIIPQLKNGAFGAGYLAGLEQIELRVAKKIGAGGTSNGGTVVIDHSVHTSANYSKVWVMFLFLLFLVGLGYLSFWLYTKNSARRLAQLNAITARTDVNNLITRLSAKLTEQTALGVAVTAARHTLDQITEELADYGNNFSTVSK